MSEAADRVSDFNKKAEQVLNSRIQNHLANTQKVLENIEKHQPTDKVVKASALIFAPKEDAVEGVVVKPGDRDYEAVHKWAMGQIGERAGIPKAFQDRLRSEDSKGWGGELLAHNLNELFKHDKSKYLLRSVNGQVRGFLSDRYRRLDSRPLVESYLQSLQAVGAVPYESHFTETKIAIKSVLPRLFKLNDREVLALGVMFGNSDFGNGPLEVSIFAERLICMNGMVASRDLRKIHLGARLSEDMEWSNKTYQLDTEANASAIKDLVRNQLGPTHLNKFLDTLKAANEDEMKPEQITQFLSKALTKERTKEVVEAFNSANVVDMPAGQTRYRLSQAISWVANQMKDEEDKLDMQRLAGVTIEKRPS
jgi:hypothetical protein